MSINFWLVAAGIALIAEFMTGSLHLLIIAIALAGGGMASWFGLNHNGSLLIASILSIVGYVLLRRYKRRHPASPSNAVDLEIGQPVNIIELDANGYGQVSYRGAEWAAQLNEPMPDIIPSRAYLVDRQGNTLIISFTQPERS